MQNIQSLFHKYHEIISYIIFGILTTLVNIIIFMILQKISRLTYLENNTIAWFISVVFAFITNKIYVFKSNTWRKKTVFKELFLFFSSRFVTLLIDDAIMFIGISLLSQNTDLTKVIDQIIIIILNFILSKLSFKNKINKNS